MCVWRGFLPVHRFTDGIYYSPSWLGLSKNITECKTHILLFSHYEFSPDYRHNLWKPQPSFRIFSLEILVDKFDNNIYSHFWIVWFLYLFNVFSVFVDYLLPKPYLQKNSICIIYYTFPWGINPKVNIIVQLEFELTHNDVTVKHVNPFATGSTSPSGIGGYVVKGYKIILAIEVVYGI